MMPWSPLHALAAAAVFLFAAKTLAWLIQRRLGNAGIVDGIWAWALGGLAAWFALVGTTEGMARWALALMGGLWGLRLGTYLWRRNWRTPEDWRYAEFRASWGQQASWKMFWFFQFQNLFTLLLAGCAFMPAAYNPGQVGTGGVLLAVLIWVIAITGEAVADAQLQSFKAQSNQPHAHCDVGLWRYSRHPNYFFECLHWVAYVPLAWGSAWVLAAMVAPLVMALLVLKISGIPLLERRLLATRPGYAAYAARTNRLFPWWPRA